MRVKTYELKEGCILSSDIKSLSSFPIVPKKTVLNDIHIKAIHAFLIKEVEIEPTLVNGEPFRPEEKKKSKVEQDSHVQESTSFTEDYLKVVQKYKKMFKNWQSGSMIDVPMLRQFLVPFLEKAVESPSELFKLHHYSTKEDYVYHHAISVSALSALLGKKLQFPKGDWIQIGLAGALSDSGMAKIDVRILNKQESLTPMEFEEVKQHPKYSFVMLKQVTVLKDSVRQAVVQHHERIDGSGYPLALKSEQLHPFGKIIAVADVFHAMTSERSYRSKQSPFKVLESILQDSFGKFDVRVVEALTKTLTSFSTGTKVQLTNNQIGEIVFIEQKSPTRPMIKLDNGDFIQLTKERHLFIEEVLN